MKLSEYLNKKPVIKVLCFGEGKTGKTTFVTDVFNDIVYQDELVTGN